MKQYIHIILLVIIGMMYSPPSEASYRYNDSQYVFEASDARTVSPETTPWGDFKMGLCWQLYHENLYAYLIDKEGIKKRAELNKSYTKYSDFFSYECVNTFNHTVYYKYMNKLAYGFGYAFGWLLDMRLLLPLLVAMYVGRRPLGQAVRSVANFIGRNVGMVLRFVAGLLALCGYFMAKGMRKMQQILRAISNRDYIAKE